MGEATLKAALLRIHHRLLDRYGPQHWWPADEPFEVIVGAILTQSAAWTNVEKAIDNLKAAGALSPEKLAALPESEIARLVRPSGYYQVKARKLQAFARWLRKNCGSDLDRLFTADVSTLRERLLGIYGIGPETADSIILYAAGKPVFVIDTYTRRIFNRLGLAPDRDSYAAYQQLFMAHLPADAALFNEYHALLVCLGKNTCRPRPRCGECCLRDLCAAAPDLQSSPASGKLSASK
ncbi:MAG: hypothetical protein ABID87_03115 [Chloroflexota bacterium]